MDASQNVALTYLKFPNQIISSLFLVIYNRLENVFSTNTTFWDAPDSITQLKEEVKFLREEVSFLRGLLEQRN